VTDEEIRRWQRLVGTPDDARPGTRTFEATISWLAQRGYIEREAAPPDVVIRSRASVVAYARAELGEQDPNKYFREVAPQFIGQPHTIAWCGIFWLWCLHQAGLTDHKWVTGLGFASGYLPVVSIPEPADGMYFGSPRQHYAVVERVINGKVYTIEGNTMLAPKEGVTAKEYPITSEEFRRNGGCYFSIGKLVRP
jgi:hypothetical protein